MREGGPGPTASLIAAEVSYAAPARSLVERVSLRVEAGRIHAVLGPNGAGKSTLLRLLSGELAPDTGEITLNGRPLAAWTPRERARQRAVLPQSHALAFGFTAAQVVELGRLPCPRHGPQAESDVVRAALARAGVSHLAEQKYPTLSGGERARVQLARVMAQVWEPLTGALAGHARFLLLDEPTASLDLAHQHDCLRAARRFAASGAGVLAVLHDPNLALAYGDDATVLRQGRVLATGPTAATLTGEILSSAYGISVAIHQLPGLQRPLIWTSS